jgi:hypothetical protein
MTPIQKDIMEKLFAGGSIAAYNGKYRLRDSKHSPVRSFAFSTFHRVRKLLRKHKTGVLVLDKRMVKKLSGHNWVKKYYKEQHLNRFIICRVEQVPEEGIIKPCKGETVYFIREQFNDRDGKQAKAVSLDGRKAIWFISHGTDVIYYPNKTKQ